MVKRAFIIAATIITSILNAQTVSSLNGTVKTSDNIPLKDVIVKLAKYPEIADTTDTNGVFSLMLGVTGTTLNNEHNSITRITGGMISFAVNSEMAVCIEAFSLSGKLLCTPFNKVVPKGSYKIPIDLFSSTTQMVLVRMRRGSQVELFRIIRGSNGKPVAMKIMRSKNTVATNQSLSKISSIELADTLVFERADLGILRVPLDSYTSKDSIRITTTTITGTLTDNSIGTSGTYKIALFTSNWYWDWGSGGVVISRTFSVADKFSIEGFVPAGNYYLMAYRDVDGNGSYTYRGNAVDPMGEYSTTSVEITKDGLKNVNIIITPRSISGTVTGAPLGWKVKAIGPGTDEPTADIAEDGSYLLKLYRAGTYSLSVYDPNGAATIKYPESIDLTGSNTLAQNIDFSVTEPVTISGTLTDNSIGTDGIYKVALFTSNWYWDWGSGGVVACTTLTEAGAFTFSGTIPAGNYYLMAYRDADGDGSYTYRGNAVDPMGEYSTTPVAISEDGLKNANITITPRSISGMATGAPSGWKVKAIGPGTDEPTADIAEDGSYLLKLYRTGTYSLSVYDPNGAATIKYPEPIDLTGSNTLAQNIDFSVTEPITISGTLTDNSIGTDGVYKVALFTSNWYWDWGSGGVVACTTLTEAGAFTFSGTIPAGNYYLMAYRDADGDGSYTYRGNAVDPMGEYSTTPVAITEDGLKDANITITPRLISGTVTGVPSGWKVKVSGPGTDEPTADITEDGSYVIKLYRAGIYTLSAYDPNGAATVAYPEAIDLTGSNTHAQDINIDM